MKMEGVESFSKADLIIIAEEASSKEKKWRFEKSNLTELRDSIVRNTDKRQIMITLETLTCW